jgi:thiosulfate/3-mercaptopyruvate sulfurtransferase
MHLRIMRLGIVFLSTALAQQLDVIQPKDLAAELQATVGKPAVIHVGFGVLYRGRHIAGSIYAGPASTPEGLSALKAAVAGLPRDREIVVYCGCCPWDHCPNVKPALDLLRQMGFKRAKALMIPTNMAADWTDHGYPVEPARAK